MRHKISLLYNWFIWIITFFLPDIPFIMRFRGWLYSLFMKKVGKNFQVSSGARIFGSTNIQVGNNVFIATNVVINGGGLINLCDEVMIGIGSIVVAGNHTIKNGSYRFGKRSEEPIFIGKGSWIAANSTVVAGAVVPPSSLIAANSVVVGKLNSPGLYGGIPARLIRRMDR